MSVEPYYRSADGSIVVFHAKFEDVLAAGLVPVEEVTLVHDDPPYGVGERTDRRSKGRGDRSHMIGGSAQAIDFPPVAGDNEPFDPSPLLALKRPLVLWGANHYADRVPASPSWILWDKREGQGSDDNADGELAWSNLGGPLRIFGGGSFCRK